MRISYRSGSAQVDRKAMAPKCRGAWIAANGASAGETNRPGGMLPAKWPFLDHGKIVE